MGEISLPWGLFPPCEVASLRYLGLAHLPPGLPPLVGLVGKALVAAWRRLTHRSGLRRLRPVGVKPFYHHALSNLDRRPYMPCAPPGIGQLAREPRTFPHPLLTVRCSFKQRRLGICRAESGPVSDIRTGARRPSLIMSEPVCDVFVFVRDTFTN